EGSRRGQVPGSSQQKSSTRGGRSPLPRMPLAAVRPKTASLAAFARGVSRVTRHFRVLRRCLHGKSPPQPRDVGAGGHRPWLSPNQGGRVMSAPQVTGRMPRRRKVVFIVTVGALVAAALAAFFGQSVTASAQPAKPPWLDAHKPIQARVNALLG